MDHPPTYRAYMLRIWRDDTQHIRANDRWRFSLEDPHTGERIGFASVGQLCDYLLTRISPRDQLDDSVTHES